MLFDIVCAPDISPNISQIIDDFFGVNINILKSLNLLGKTCESPRNMWIGNQSSKVIVSWNLQTSFRFYCPQYYIATVRPHKKNCLFSIPARPEIFPRPQNLFIYFFSKKTLRIWCKNSKNNIFLVEKK
jgi:hypothetical protein